MEPFEDNALDALFAEARAEAPPPLSAAFEARLVAAALAAQPVAAVAPGWGARLRAFLSDFGGAPSLAGMGVAGLAGVWIGFATPGPTADLVSSFWQGAASVSPSVSDWTDTGSDLGYSTGAELLSLLGSETE